MIYTDEEGNKFEQLENPVVFNDTIKVEDIVIRPVTQSPKWEVSLQLGISDCPIIQVDLPNATPDQAQLIKEAVEALTEEIFNKTIGDIDVQQGTNLAIAAARTAMENKS